ncbi:hypothetical protein SprV_0902694700 [Sparganum proliferum]
MVCVPCLIVPFFLWIFHKFFLPYLLIFFPNLRQRLGYEEVEQGGGDTPVEDSTAPPEKAPDQDQTSQAKKVQ